MGTEDGTLQWADPQPLLAVPGTPQVGKNFFLDEVGPVKGFVSVAPVSFVWKDRAGGFEVKLTEGLTASEVQLDDPEWIMDPSEDSLQGGTGRAGSDVSKW